MRHSQIHLLILLPLTACKGPGTEPPPSYVVEADADTDTDSDADTDTDLECAPIHPNLEDTNNSGDFFAACGCDFSPGNIGDPNSDSEWYFSYNSRNPVAVFTEGQLRCEGDGNAERLWYHQGIQQAPGQLSGVQYFNTSALLELMDESSVRSLIQATNNEWAYEYGDYTLVLRSSTHGTEVGVDGDGHSSIAIIPDIQTVILLPDFGIVWTGGQTGKNAVAGSSNIETDIKIFLRQELPIPQQDIFGLHPNQVINQVGNQTSFRVLLTPDEALLAYDDTQSQAVVGSSLSLFPIQFPSPDARIYNISFRGILSHELGHAYGLGHWPQDVGFVMEPVTVQGRQRIERSEDECRAAAFLQVIDSNLSDLPPCQTDNPL